VFTASAAEGREVSGDEGELQWFSLEQTASLPTVEDLPTLLPRVARFLEGAPPFSAVYNYDATGKLNIRIDG
jgi:hypothetical protein